MAEASQQSVNLQDDMSDSIIASIISCMVLAGAALIARIASRHLQKLKLTASDYLCVGGLIGAWVISLLLIEEAKLGLGKHAEIVSFQNLREILLMAYIVDIFYSITFTMIKMSILLLLREIFPSKGMRIATNVVGAFVIMWGIELFLATVFTCNPINGFWEVTIPSTCIDARWFFVGNSIPNILADLAILILPINKVWRLQMSRATKIAISLIFLLGGFVIIATALRIHYMLDLSPQDWTWTYHGIGLWSAVEINVAVISACLPTIRPVLKLLQPAFLVTRLSKLRSSRLTDEKSDTLNSRGPMVRYNRGAYNPRDGRHGSPDYTAYLSDPSSLEHDIVDGHTREESV